jgi:hypothetical protein
MENLAVNFFAARRPPLRGRRAAKKINTSGWELKCHEFR